MSFLLVQTFDGEELVDAFHVTPEGGDAAALFDQIGRLPCTETELSDRCLCIDLQEGADLNHDPLTIPSENAPWFLFEFLKMDRRTHTRLVKVWRKDHTDACGHRVKRGGDQP